MAINSVTDLRNTDPGQTAFTVRQNPVGGSTSCHAMQVSQGATSGAGAGVNVVSDNSEAPAYRARAAGPLVRLYNAANELKFEIDNTGAITVVNGLTLTGAITASSVTTSGNASVGGTLAVTGATTLSAGLTGTSASFSTTLGVTGAATLSSTLAVTGNTTLSTVSTSGAATLASAAITNAATVGGTLGVTGATTLSSTLTVGGATTITGNLTDAGDLLVRDSHAAPAKAYRFRSSGGALDTDFGGNDWYWSNFPNADFSGTQRTYMRWENGAATMHIVAEAQFKADVFGARVHTLNGASNTLGFHGAVPVAKQTVAGSRGGNAALASLITALATVGLVTDGTSA